MRFNGLICVLAAIILSFPLTGKGQNTGFGGKRVVIKPTLVNGIDGILSGGSVEYVLNRNVTLSAGVNFVSNTIEPNYVRDNGGLYDQNENCALDKPVDHEAELSSRAFFIEPRLYPFSENFIPAPNGFFSYLQLKGGTLDLEGKYNIGILYNVSECPEGNDYLEAEFSYQNMNFYSGEIGVGYQKFFTPWLTASLKGGIDINKLSVVEEGHLRTLAKSYNNQIGSNFYDFRTGLWGVGLSAYLEVGLMVF